ncbi:UNVERIFIED_CONTAM: hypothetical protein PYX00_010874 [Menopon gallinae]|uniref:Uncharacterized protein n=1 Tax=Menopon gallinae TaxID=328185 RepID=A0AAW2H6K3_9NEOP
MQLDQITLLQEKINKVVQLTRRLREENQALKIQLAEASQRLKDWQEHEQGSLQNSKEKQKALSLALGLLDSMLDENADEPCLEQEQEKALKYLADEDIAYLAGLVDCYQTHVKTASLYVVGAQACPLKAETSLKVAILAGVLLADKFFKQKRRLKELSTCLDAKQISSSSDQQDQSFCDSNFKGNHLKLVEGLVSKLESVLEEN